MAPTSFPPRSLSQNSLLFPVHNHFQNFNLPKIFHSNFINGSFSIFNLDLDVCFRFFRI
ncbi:unnamed protein product [Meloidogyne enterolobii]|uniref:Uncharacterized protein n=1 Tax=Meloidogyne enterolobii TaxID=390850 RepID=A0ACB0ZW78_MELEN